MVSQLTTGNALSLRIENGWMINDDTFQLNRARHNDLGQIAITTFETERSITLVCGHLNIEGKSRRLNLPGALQCGLLELVETSKSTVIAFPRDTAEPPGRLKIPPKPSPKHSQVELGIYTETTHSKWKEVLEPGKSYALRFSESNGEVWAYYTDDFGSYEDVPTAQKLHVGREKNTVQFTVRDDTAPPKLFADLEMPKECHLTGEVPFTFVIEYSSDSQRPITIDKSRTPLSVFEEDLKSMDQIIDCRNADTGEEVRWVGFFGCYDTDPHPSFPSDDDFVEILPDKSWRFECTLENLECEEDTVRSMIGLEAGQTYKTQIAARMLSRISRWQYGRKEELLSGNEEDKKKRWDIDYNVLGNLSVKQIGEPVVFRAVE